MNIGLILPAASKREEKVMPRLIRRLAVFLFSYRYFEVEKIELMEGLNLVVCTLSDHTHGQLVNEGLRKKIRARLVKLFEDDRVWPILEHPDLKNLYDPHPFRYDEKVASQIAADRFLEVLKLISGVGDLRTREIAVTGGSAHLEYAIARLITKVKSMNLLLPEGSLEPNEAELAFIETGIPVHITTDTEVLKRSALWLRFPDDHESFDVLPKSYEGIIIDFGDAKIIDTKNKKIFTLYSEFSDKIKRKIGHNILSIWEKGVLESLVITLCANAWDISATETSIRLGMRLSFKS